MRKKYKKYKFFRKFCLRPKWMIPSLTKASISTINSFGFSQMLKIISGFS